MATPTADEIAITKAGWSKSETDDRIYAPNSEPLRKALLNERVYGVQYPDGDIGNAVAGNLGTHFVSGTESRRISITASQYDGLRKRFPALTDLNNPIPPAPEKSSPGLG